MDKNIRTEIIMVLDRSGSMASCANDVVGGFNTFIEEQKNAEGEATVTLAQFDTRYEMVYENVPVDKVSNLQFVTGGGTALLDAIGRTVTAAKTRIMTQRPGPDAVIFVIITDGEENSSREFNLEKVKSLIQECESEYKWKFVYLGANQDAFSEAGKMGIAASGAMTYNSDQGTRCMFTSVSRSTSAYREKLKDLSVNSDIDSTAAIDSLNKESFFSEEDKKDQTKFGVEWN